MNKATVNNKIEASFLKEEIEKTIMDPSQYNRDEFPHMGSMSSAVFYSQLPVPKVRVRPEFVFLKDYNSERDLEKVVTISEWNMAWEMGQLRGSFFWERAPEKLHWLRDYDMVNMYLVPEDKKMPYLTYAPFLHLLPMKTRLKFGLPLVNKGLWPFIVDHDRFVMDHIITSSFLKQLSKAFAYHVWPLLDAQSKTAHFSSDDSLLLLAHNLKFWMPFLYEAVEERLHEFDRVKPKDKKHINKMKELQKQHPEIDVKLPLTGGPIWIGEDDAWRMTRNIVDKADGDSRLRGIIDAIRSNRVEDDFSDKWSYAKEDFERKLYSKRSKIKVSFVEIEDAVPIHSSSTEIDENMLWDDLLSVVDERQKRVIVCLRKGVTNHKEISELLGYKNHSPVTKMLAQIRKRAASILL